MTGRQESGWSFGEGVCCPWSSWWHCSLEEARDKEVSSIGSGVSLWRTAYTLEEHLYIFRYVYIYIYIYMFMYIYIDIYIDI